MPTTIRSMICAAVVLAACGGGEAPATGTGTTASAQAHVRAAATAAAPRRPLTAARLAPTLHPLAPRGGTPTAIAIELAASPGDDGEVPAGTALRVTPEVPGRLTRTGPAELTFTPSHPLAASQRYEVELTRLGTADGAVSPPAGERWRVAFDTPAFGLVGGGPTAVDLDAHAVTVRLAFSAPIVPNLARAALAFEVDGAPPAGLEVVPTRDPHLLAVRLTAPRLRADSRVAVRAVAEVPAASGATTRAVAATYDLGALAGHAPVSLDAARAAEGAGGHYLEVACSDGAARGEPRNLYDEDLGMVTTSSRCQLAPEALAHVRVEPPVKDLRVTAGALGFRLFGDFRRGAYVVTIERGAATVDGGVVEAPFSTTIPVPARRPQLAFAAAGRYLPRAAWRELGVRSVNLEQAALVVRQVPPENLVFWLGDDDRDAADERTSNVLLDRVVPLAGAPDAAATSWLDVASLLPATTRGVLELSLEGGGARASARLLLTNLSLVAKRTQDPAQPWRQRVQAWALDIETAALVDGVELTLVRKSGKVVARCTTAGEQGCVLDAGGPGGLGSPGSPGAPASGDDPDHAAPFALVARKGDDLTYLRYQDLRAELAESQVSGEPFAATAPYRATAYADRGVYRPGETAHVVAVVRDPAAHAPPRPVPVDVEVLDPRARVVRRLTATTNAAGVVAVDHALPAFADTGRWRIAFAVAGKALTAHEVLVEEFVPERLRAAITPAAPRALAGELPRFAVEASYLFGGSAVDSGVELTCAIAPARFAPREHGDLVYGVAPRGKPVGLGQARDQLDPTGRASLACPDDAGRAPFASTGELTATAAVLEAGSGRATVRTARVLVHPERYYLGLRTAATRATAGAPLAVEGLVVDWDGRVAPAATGRVHVELLHLEGDYGYGVDEDTGEARYDRWLRAVPEGSQDVDVRGGAFRLEVTPGQAELGYVVRVTAGRATTELVLRGDYPYDEAGGWGDGERVDRTPRPARATQLAVELPRELRVGERATARIQAPYRGRVLWTVETDRVVAAAWRDVAGGAATWDFALKDFAPNVYVTAFLVKDPHLESRAAFLPDRAYGVASAPVAPVALRQEVRVTAPAEVRSSSPLVVTVDVGGPARPGTTFATVAVVDEGVLALTDFRSPDPLGQLLKRRALGVETFETIGWTVLHQPAGASSRTGGGDDGGEAEGGAALARDRVQPIRPVALFSGVVPVGPDGKVAIPLQLPAYRGELRVMAVTASPERLGHAEARVVVRDPLVVQATLPRFLTQDDEVDVPVFLTNTTTRPMDLDVTLGAEALAPAGAAPGDERRRAAAAPALVVAGAGRAQVRVAAGRSETVTFRVTARAAYGAARLTAVARGAGVEGRDGQDVPLAPAGPRETVTQRLRVAAGRLPLAGLPALAGWVPTSEATTLWMTANPYGEALAHLDDLVRYPHGCLEQTVSTTRPLIRLARLAPDAAPALASPLGERAVEERVAAGIHRVLAMETPSGGFGYWPGATEPLAWASAYATDMLLDARDAGYAVPADRLAAVLAWLEARAARFERSEPGEPDPWAGGAPAAGAGRDDAHAEAYLHYVLARAGKARKARAQALLGRLSPSARGEQAEDRYLLMAALYLAGDRRHEAGLRAVDASPIALERGRGWTFYSDLRRRGQMLSIYHDLFGAQPGGEALAARVAQALAAQGGGLNTQELAWGVTALGKWATDGATRGVAGGTLTAGGATLAPRPRGPAAPPSALPSALPPAPGKAPPAPAGDLSWTVARASELPDLALDVPRGAEGLWLFVRASGVRAGARYALGGQGLAVRRTYRGPAHEEVDLAAGALRLGDLLYVELEVENKSGVRLDNLALVDRIPAGLEIENPRLGRGARPDWLAEDAQWAPDYLELRDDRLAAFGALAPGERRTLTYAVRAVSSGAFAVPPVELEAMYDPTLWARAGGGRAVIGGPWGGKTL